MRKSVLLSAILIFSLTLSGMACEICGCSNSNFQIGLLPSFNKGFFGVRYTAFRFSSSLRSDPTQFSKDSYKNMELWGGYNFKKLQIMAFAPYIMATKRSDDGTTISNGLGDLMVLANYKILNVASLSRNESITVRNELFIGGGVKLPTGVNNLDTKDPDFNLGDFNSQPGTGSVDFLLNATHNLAWNRSGFVTNLAYRINTRNSQDYQFGNRTYLTTSYYYTFTYSAIKIRPAIGINYQGNGKNTFEGQRVEDTQGYNLNSTIGANIMRKKIGVNATAFLPVSQNLYDGQTKLQSRMTIALTYSF